MIKLLNHILRKEEIRRGDGQIYLNRWTLFRTKPNGLFSLLGLGDIRLYVHKFTASDHTKCQHDHPNKLTSFIFKNGYSEEYWDPKDKQTKVAVYRAPCLRTFPAAHSHRVTLLNEKPCWSIVFMRPKTREWGFWVTQKSATGGKERRWVQWEEYEDEYGGTGGCD